MSFFPSTAVSPLHLRGVTNTAGELIEENLSATFARDYTPLEGSSEYQGPVSIVGAGPSLFSTYQDIVGDIIACNSAHDFLVAKGIIPKYAMIWDAHPVMAKILKPREGVIYLVASRCHPGVFKMLEGFDVRVWHALDGDGVLEKHLVRHQRMEPMVAGGSSSVMRAAFLAPFMGYTKDMHLFGIDSCYAEGKTHVGASIVDQQKISLRVCGKWFVVAPWMAMQAGDFKIIAPVLQGQGIRPVVHGTGLLPYTATFIGVETPDMKVGLAERIKRRIHAAIVLFLELKNSPQLLGGSNAGFR